MNALTHTNILIPGTAKVAAPAAFIDIKKELELLLMLFILLVRSIA